MIYYRLLRDNKETGPYSEEEMIAKGFKPYDLLWAEGRSAGWQYPSEINAFKKYAPIIEEQPYDRFYKKQPAQKLQLTEEKNTPVSYASQLLRTNEAVPPPQQPVARPVYNFNVQELPARHIHVTLPSGNTINLTTLVAKKEIKESRELDEPGKLAVNAENTATEKKQEFFADVISLPQAVTKETRTIAPSIDTTVKNTIDNTAYPPAGQAGSFSWSLILGAIVGIATMVGLGIMIGLSINRGKNEAAFNEALRDKTKQTPFTHNIKPVTPAATESPAVVSAGPVVQHSTTPAKNKELVQRALVKNTPPPAVDIAKEDKNTGNTEAAASETSTQETPVQYAKPLANINAANIEKSLHISENDFKTGAFGGISGLKCTLYNGSAFPLVSVEVAVDYIQANSKIYKTEKLLFKDISAGSQSTVDAPGSSRGIKVISRIIKINPRGALSNTTAKS